MQVTDLVVDHHMDGAVCGEGWQVRQMHGLVDNSLTSEGSITMEQNAHHLHHTEQISTSPAPHRGQYIICTTEHVSTSPAPHRASHHITCPTLSMSVHHLLHTEQCQYITCSIQSNVSTSPAPHRAMSVHHLYHTEQCQYITCSIQSNVSTSPAPHRAS